MAAEQELRDQLHRLRRNPAVDLRPATAYEAVTRQMVETLADELKEIKGRLNGLLWMVAAAIVIDVLLRISGAGSR